MVIIIYLFIVFSYQPTNITIYLEFVWISFKNFARVWFYEVFYGEKEIVQCLKM